jgi:serine/threonine protein kinase
MNLRIGVLLAFSVPTGAYKLVTKDAALKSMSVTKDADLKPAIAAQLGQALHKEVDARKDADNIFAESNMASALQEVDVGPVEDEPVVPESIVASALEADTADDCIDAPYATNVKPVECGAASKLACADAKCGGNQLTVESVSKLGQGGQADVYKVAGSTEYVLKLFKDADAKSLKAARKESLILSALTTKFGLTAGFVPMIGAGKPNPAAGKKGMLALPLASGDLEGVVGKNGEAPLTADEVVRLAKDLIPAAFQLGDVGVAINDIKEENVLVFPADSPKYKFADFGLACVAAPDKSTALAQVGLTVGKRAIPGSPTTEDDGELIRCVAPSSRDPIMTEGNFSEVGNKGYTIPKVDSATSKGFSPAWEIWDGVTKTVPVTTKLEATCANLWGVGLLLIYASSGSYISSSWDSHTCTHKKPKTGQGEFCWTTAFPKSVADWAPEHLKMEGPHGRWFVEDPKMQKFVVDVLKMAIERKPDPKITDTLV